MREKSSQTSMMIVLVLGFLLVVGILAAIQLNCCGLLHIPLASATCDYSTCSIIEELLHGTLTRRAEVSLTPLPSATTTAQTENSPQAPYEPTLYAERQAMLREFSTAAGPATYVQFYASETALVSAYQGTPTATVSPTQMPGYAFCTWEWAQQVLPAITNLAQIALSMYREYDVTVWVEAFGENCVGENREVLYFAPMNTDFHVTVMIDSLTDETAIAETITNIYQALKAGLEEAWLPAPFGRLNITLKTDSEEKFITATFSSLATLFQQGLRDKTLLEALGFFR